MRSIFSNIKILPWAQCVLVLTCIVLGAVYLKEPTHGTALAGINEWVDYSKRLIGIGRLDDSTLLEPRLEIAYFARPLIDYGELQFKGCDLSLHRNSLDLVTYWHLDTQALVRTLELRFVLPESKGNITSEQPLDAAVLYMPLPASFYTAKQRGEVWLKVIDSTLKQTLPAKDSLRPADANGWIRVCR